MNIVKFKLSSHPLRILLPEDSLNVGSQFDNYATKFVFERPPENESDSLLLILGNGSENFDPLNIGIGNELLLSNYYTQTTVLQMQAAFERDDIVIAHSNVVHFLLRKSIRSGSGAIEAPPQSISRLRDKAFTNANFEDSFLSFQNFDGNTVSSVYLSGFVCNIY